MKKKMRTRGTKNLALTLALLMLIPFTALAAADAPAALPNGVYKQVTGEVEQIRPYTGTDGKEVENQYFVHIVDEKGSKTVLLVMADSCSITGVRPIAGDQFSAWYDAGLPAIMIFPPQYTAAAFAVNLDEAIFVKVARFDEKLLSYDGGLVIHVGDTTVIRQGNGSEFIGGADALVNRILAVVYSITTRSMPPQTTPEKIFVLYERAVTLPATVPDMVAVTPEAGIPKIIGMEVEGTQINEPTPYYKEVIGPMVPLRVVAEALGFVVQWEDATQSIMLNNSISLTIGRDYYTYAKMAPITLGAAPEITNGLTYVPLKFFKEVAGMTNAYLLEGLIEINNGKPMN